MSSTSPNREDLDALALKAFDRRLRRANERLWERILAWAEILDALGWCVALKTSDDSVYLSANALADTRGFIGGAGDWRDFLVRVGERNTKRRRVNDENIQVWQADGHAHEAAPPSALTRREAEVLGWLREGKTGPEIAVILGCARRTVESHLARLYRKLGVSSRMQAVSRAVMPSPDEVL